MASGSERAAPAAADSEVGTRFPRQRHLVVGAIFLLALITYIDRGAISTAKGPLAAELGLSDQAMGAVFSAFVLGYALAQVPAGWFADRCGPRLALAALVALWSLFTGLTGMVSRLGPLLAIRFLFGAAEAGAFPGSARVFYNWLPPGERGLANGILFSGALFGGGIAFPICAWLLSLADWRWMFYLLALPGLLWAGLWLGLFRNQPRQPVVQQAVGSGPGMNFAEVFRSRAMALAMAQYFAGNFTFFIGMTWMYPYLTERFQLSRGEAAGYSMVPLVCGSIANFAAGLVVDLLYRSRHRAWSRRLPGVAGFVVAAAGIASVSAASTPAAAVAGFAAAIFGIEMTISPSWAYCMDIGGKNSGAVGGAMNMVGNFGAFVSANAFPFLRRLTGSPAAYFFTAALLDLAAIACWVRMRPPDGQPPRTQPSRDRQGAVKTEA
jgi:ACS family glucarate transporter-like MFS transporter